MSLARGLIDAEAEIASAGLTMTPPATVITNVQADDNKVASQSPSGGTQVDEGSSVDVTVFVYQPDVPDFTGMTLAEAQAAATAAGLGTVTSNASMDVADPDSLLWGTIVAQNPAAGTSVAVGTNIEVGIYIEP